MWSLGVLCGVLRMQELNLANQNLCTCTACLLLPPFPYPDFDEQLGFRVVRFDHCKPEAVGVGVYFEKMSAPECGVRVARLQPGGAADVEGSIAVGDVLVSVDDVDVAGERVRVQRRARVRARATFLCRRVPWTVHAAAQACSWSMRCVHGSASACDEIGARLMLL